MFPGSRRSRRDRVSWTLVLGVLLLNVPSSVARSSQASSGQVLLVDDRAGKLRLQDADRCVDPGSDDDAGSYCVLHPEDSAAVISTVAHAPPPSAGITKATSAKLNALLANEAILHDPGATVVYRVRGAADGTRTTIHSALETGTKGSGAVIHSRDVGSASACDAAWNVLTVDSITEGSTNALVHDRCGGDGDGLNVDEGVLEKVAALAGATLVTLDVNDGGGWGFRFDDLGGDLGVGVVVKPWHPGTASGGGQLAADSWRWRLSRELACLLRLPTPEARVPPYYVELRSAGLAASVHGVGSPEHVAVSRLVFAAVGSQSTLGAGAAKADNAEISPDKADTVVSIVIACDDETVDPTELGRGSRARRRLAEEAETAQMFRRMTTATVTGVLLFVAVFVGILAMGTMTFPRDCVLWPSDKTTMKFD